MHIDQDKILVLGSGSLLWHYLGPALRLAGYTGYCSGRQRPQALPEGFVWTPASSPLPEVERVISLLPLWLLPPQLATMKKCRQLIAFGSTSVLVKDHSQDPREQVVAIQLKDAEAAIADHARRQPMSCIILRPTMIYGGGHDRNITAIAQFIHRWRFFPVAWPGTGRRQPVHAADLATAAVACLDNPDASNAAFNLGGGETLSYRAMVRRIFAAMGRPACILPLPAVLPALALRLAGAPYAEFSPALFRRMNQDLVFDAGPAAAVLDYRPRPFAPELPPILVASKER